MSPSTDPWELDAERATFHQLATFVTWPHSLVEAVAASPLFDVRERETSVRAEWMASSVDEGSPYPLGRITMHPNGILLDAFSESRMEDLKRHVNALGSWRVTPDETRAVSLEEVLRKPSLLMHPMEEADGRVPSVRELATWYLRAAWPFQSNPELKGRAPNVAASTGRGRAQIEELLPELGLTLRKNHARFPLFDPEELRSLILPGEVDPSTAPDPSHISKASRRA